MFTSIFGLPFACQGTSCTYAHKLTDKRQLTCVNLKLNSFVLLSTHILPQNVATAAAGAHFIKLIIIAVANWESTDKYLGTDSTDSAAASVVNMIKIP